MPVSVLVVEDSPYDRELACYALRGFATPAGPIDVGVACTWAGAHQQLQSRPFDLVILDFDLPGPNGLEILQVLAGMSHPPVIMLTGQQDVGKAVEMLRLGAVEYVQKNGTDWLGDVRGAVLRALARARAERARAAAEAELARRAEEAATVKEEILANFSHELRTPLNVIQGYADLLLETGLEPDLARETLGRIRSSATRLGDVVTAVLELKSVKEGTATVRPSRFSLEALARELEGEIRAGATDPVRIEWSSGGLDVVEHDREKVRRILLELLGNAVKFAAGSGVRVKVCRRVPDGLTLVVSDEGPGFPLSRLAEALEDLRQLDGSATREHGGLGLGLGLVRRLAGQLGGAMHVESAPGRGTRVTVELPPCAPGEALLLGASGDPMAPCAEAARPLHAGSV